MLRSILFLIFLSSCAVAIVNKSGGDKAYQYLPEKEYSTQDLKELTPALVTSSEREPRLGKLKDLFGKNQKALKRVGVIVFESQIQPTREGLAKKNEIYLSEQGKQLITEKYLRIWEESFKFLGTGLEYVSTSQVKKAPSFNQYGMVQDDYIKSNKVAIAPDDIFFLDSGKKTTMVTTLNPRGMRDMSFVLVPAYELMGGPKWSEHNKHFINDVSKELNLDAVIVVMSEVSWTAAHTDKHSGEYFAEEMKLNLKSSVLVSLSNYHGRLKNLNLNETPGHTICYKSYESLIKIPVEINVPKEKKNFETIEAQILSPMMKSYKDLSQMMIMQIVEDLKKTH